MVRRFRAIHASVGAEGGARERITEILRRHGRDVEHVDSRTLPQQLGSIEALLCAQPPAVDWSDAHRLRLIQIMGSGVERLWPAKGLRAEVQIASARGIHLPEMRDHALALLLAFERGLPALAAQQRERRWERRPTGSLHGKTVVVLGLGEVGQSVAAACAALGMHVIGVRAHPRPTPHVREVHGPEALLAVLGRANYVVVLLPLTEETRGLVGVRALSAMRPDAVLVHLSRGGIVDERALVQALRLGALRGAALDVFESEPLPRDSLLWDAPNVLVTPHVAGWVEGYVERVLELFLENLERVERGEPPRTRVDPSQGY